MYLNDYWYPRYRGFTGWTPPSNWNWSSVGFLDVLTKQGYIMGKIYFTSDQANKYNGICPDGTPDWYVYTSTGSVLCPCIDPGQRYSEAYSYNTSQIDFGYNAKLPATAKKLGRVKRPGNTIMFCESRYGELNLTPSGASTEFPYIYLPNPYYWGSCGRHMRIQLVNAVFVDGHAQAVLRQEYIDGLGYTP